jgi:hypothetical protein
MSGVLGRTDALVPPVTELNPAAGNYAAEPPAIRRDEVRRRYSVPPACHRQPALQSLGGVSKTGEVGSMGVGPFSLV